ncbi:MAG: hypothetical protein K6D59_03870 [Bacteroidales bacterium]|nr:hypothetical protein [Bacteroidales bacterium]
MELYAKPTVTISEDGSVHIDMKRITPEYIEARLNELSIPAQMGYDIPEYEGVIQCATSHQDAINGLKWRFGLVPIEAEFLLGLTVEEKKTYFIRENCEAEIARWEALKKLLATQ